MPLFNIQIGRTSARGLWTPGLYDAQFAARDVEAAKAEADRRLQAREIRVVRAGDEVRVIGHNATARRRVDGGVWKG